MAAHEEPAAGPDGSVTQWIDRMCQGDDDAVARLWDRYFERTRRLADRRLHTLNSGRDCDEDVALSAFHAMVDRGRAGGFDRFRNRGDLWQLLLVITLRKCSNVARAERRRPTTSPPPGAEAERQWLESLSAPASGLSLENLLATCREQLAELEPNLQEVALLRLQGWTNQEMSERFGRSVKSIERWLARIRSEWKPA